MDTTTHQELIKHTERAVKEFISAAQSPGCSSLSDAISYLDTIVEAIAGLVNNDNSIPSEWKMEQEQIGHGNITSTLYYNDRAEVEPKG